MKIVNRKIKELIPATYNPRRLSGKQFTELKKSFENLGTLEPAVINVNPERMNIIISGHQRLKVAESLGMIEYPCVEVNFSEKKEREANIRMNKNTGEWDFDILANEFDLDDLKDWGFDDLPTIKIEETEGLTDQDEIPEPPKEPVTKKGDVWILGNHRLICGDSTTLADVEKLVGGDKCDMLLTDPPYGVSYVGKTKDALTIENDSLSEESLSEMMDLAFGNAFIVCREGSYWYASVPAGPLYSVFHEDWKKRKILRQCLIWVKDSMVLGHSEYHYRHEPILFGWIEGGTRHKNSDRTRTTILEFDRPKRNAEHPTMKPVELWERLIQDGSRNGEVVLDIFGGSGTTIIACEKLGRKARVIEFEPKYCDVIINRWEEFTGKKAVLENG